MKRFILLVACGGCDLVIPLTEPEDVPCGPYETITPIVFDVGLEEPSDFSIHYNGTQGMVHARVKLPSNPTMTYTGPVPIVFDDATATWKLDAPRFTNINTFKLDGGHLLRDGTFFGWRDRVAVTMSPPHFERYVFTSAWTAESSPQPLESDFSKNFRPGNEIVVPIDNGELRFFVEVKLDYDGASRGQMVIRQKFAGDPWVNTSQADEIANFVDLDPSAAVMAADHKILVYAAREKAGKSRIYASRRNSDDKFELGGLVDINAESEVDDTEPWIGRDCTVLYFRRGGVTYRAQ